MRFPTLFTLALLTLASAQPASANLTLFDDFNYPVGPLDGQGSGIGWTGHWVAPNVYNVAPGSLSYSTLATSGNRAQFDPTNGAGTNALRTISSFGNPGDTFWLSFLMSYDGNIGQTTADFRLNDSVGKGYLYIGRPRGDQSFWGVQDTVSSGTPVLSSVPITAGTAVFVAVKIDLNPNPTLNDTVTVYFDPNTATTSGAAPGVPGLTFTDQNYAASDIPMALDGSAFPDPTTFPVDVNFDPIRGGTTYADVAPAVTPEPTSALLLTPAILLLKKRRPQANNE